jgi:hypothetical protein
MVWPASYAAGNARRVALLRKQDEGLTSAEAKELSALEIMVEVWVESRHPTPRVHPEALCACGICDTWMLRWSGMALFDEKGTSPWMCQDCAKKWPANDPNRQ